MFVYSSRDVLIEGTGTSVTQLHSYTATKLQATRLQSYLHYYTVPTHLQTTTRRKNRVTVRKQKANSISQHANADRDQSAEKSQQRVGVAKRTTNETQCKIVKASTNLYCASPTVDSLVCNDRAGAQWGSRHRN
jgi:hypothetical protein